MPHRIKSKDHFLSCNKVIESNYYCLFSKTFVMKENIISHKFKKTRCQIDKAYIG